MQYNQITQCIAIPPFLAVCQFSDEVHFCINTTHTYKFMLDIHAEVDEMCDPPCENGICAANNTCNCAAGYQGERCTEEGRFYNLIISTSSFKHQDA